MDLEPVGKRKRSEEGLLGLLGTYASDEEEEEMIESLEKLQKLTETGVLEGAQSDDAGPLVDIATALTAASQRLETLAQQQDTSAEQAAGQHLEEEAAEEAQEMMEDAKEELLLPAELAEPPAKPCPADIQAKVTEFLRKQEETGQTISGRLRSLPGYRNPDFLQHCVVYDNISEFGTCYPSDIFDPTNLPPEDYYDRLAVEWQELQEQRQQERARLQRVDFTKGGTQTHARPATAGLNPSSVAANIAASVLAQAKAAAGQRSSKWDTKR